MSTERAREKTIEELELQNLSDDEAIRLLELAHQGVYELGDMPEKWLRIIESVEVTTNSELARTANSTPTPRIMSSGCHSNVGESHDTGDPHHEA